MAPSSVITITTTSPKTHTRAGSLSLLSPVDSPVEQYSVQAEDPHAFQEPGPEDSRSPCPALNTLANHGYLPRSGRDISADDLMSALEDPRTYHVSHPLAEVLTRGGLALILATHRISLHELSDHVVEHGRLGIEHNASVVHKNAAAGAEFAPTRCDTRLLNELLVDEESLTLEHLARRRVDLEKVSKLDALHSEIARGEWALVLGIFGRAHGGRVPTEMMRMWLQKNRFPENWKPTHQQGLWETVVTSRALRKRMEAFKKEDELHENLTSFQLNKLAQDLQPTGVGWEGEDQATRQPPPAER